MIPKNQKNHAETRSRKDNAKKSSLRILGVSASLRAGFWGFWFRLVQGEL
jgi:hypothetical protein